MMTPGFPRRVVEKLARFYDGKLEGQHHVFDVEGFPGRLMR
jgi:hypothetical protein